MVLLHLECKTCWVGIGCKMVSLCDDIRMVRKETITYANPAHCEDTLHLELLVPRTSPFYVLEWKWLDGAIISI